MELLLCINEKCSYNENRECKMVTAYVGCMGFDDESSKYIINKYLISEKEGTKKG